MLYKISYYPLDSFGCLYVMNKITSDQICCILFFGYWSFFLKFFFLPIFPPFSKKNEVKFSYSFFEGGGGLFVFLFSFFVFRVNERSSDWMQDKQRCLFQYDAFWELFPCVIVSSMKKNLWFRLIFIICVFLHFVWIICVTRVFSVKRAIKLFRITRLLCPLLFHLFFRYFTLDHSYSSLTITYRHQLLAFCFNYFTVGHS